MAVFRVHPVRLVLLPDDAERGSIDPEADVIGVAADGDVGDGHLAEAVAPAGGFSCQCLVVFIIDDHDRPAFRARARRRVGQEAIELPRSRWSIGGPRRYQ